MTLGEDLVDIGDRGFRSGYDGSESPALLKFFQGSLFLAFFHKAQAADPTGSDRDKAFAERRIVVPVLYGKPSARIAEFIGRDCFYVHEQIVYAGLAGEACPFCRFYQVSAFR